MKKILYVGLKEVIEISYPNWAGFIMRFLWRHLEVKRLKSFQDGNEIDLVVFDEAMTANPKVQKLIKSLKCPNPLTCIGYMNAESDLENIKEDLLSHLKGGEKK